MRLALVAATVMAASSACAQNFASYRCADGTLLPVVFHRNVVNVQLDGKALRLPRRLLSVSGARYASAGVTLRIGRGGATLKRRGMRPVACAAE